MNTNSNVLTFTSYLGAARHCNNTGLPLTRIVKKSMQLYEIRLGTPTRQSTQAGVRQLADTAPASL